MGKVQVFEGENCIVFFVKTTSIFPASATITRLNREIWYFSKLIVPKEARNKRFASRMMEALVNLLDRRNIVLINEVRGHGDLDNDHLVVFYKKYGFQETDTTYRLIRKPAILPVVQPLQPK